MRVFVTGAVGGYAVPALVAAGHHVTALARADTKAQRLRELGATPVPVSLFDRDALAAAFAGHDVVVNLATALPPTYRAVFTSAWKPCQWVRSEGSAAVVDAATQAGISRVIQESVVMVYADRGAEWIDEDDPTDDFPIARGNHAAEASARRFADTGADAVILRFGLFYGRGAGHSAQIMQWRPTTSAFRPARPNSYVSSIHLGDAASAVATAINSPVGAYNVVDDDPLTARDNTLAMAEAVQTACWIHIPGRLALLLGDPTTSLTRSPRARTTRLRQTSDWKAIHPSVREGYRAMAAEAENRH